MQTKEESLHRIDQILASKTLADEGELHVKEKESHPPTSLSKILEDISNSQVAIARKELEEQLVKSHELNDAMQEADEAYRIMMEVHHQIKKAYESLVLDFAKF